MAAYARWADLNQPERQAATFVEDCRVSYHPGDWIAGREALTEQLPAARPRNVHPAHPGSNTEIDLGGPPPGAARAGAPAGPRRHGGSEWPLYGRYVDRGTRPEAGWRLAGGELRAAGAVGGDDRELPP